MKKHNDDDFNDSDGGYDNDDDGDDLILPESRGSECSFAFGETAAIPV